MNGSKNKKTFKQEELDVTEKTIHASEDLIKEHEGIRLGLAIFEQMISLPENYEKNGIGDFKDTYLGKEKKS